VELQLDSSKRLITEISQQLATEQQKLRNTLKDSDSKVKDFEASVAALSAQAEQDRHERYVLNCTIENLHAELKDKDAKLDAAENTLGSVQDLRRSLELAVQSRDAITIRLRDLEKQIDATNAKLSHAGSRLSETADECRRIEMGRAEALEEVSRLQTSATANDQARARLDNELAFSRSKLSEVEHQLALKSEEIDKKVSDNDMKLADVNAELEKVQATIASLRRELGEKDEALQRAVDASSFLQAERQACAGQISALKATIEDNERQKVRAEDDLKAAENGNLRMEQLRTQISEKDSKLAALDTHLCEMGACLEALKEKVNEKVKALALATDREESLRGNHDTLLRRISELESAFEKADHERRLAEEKYRRTESELSTVVGQMTLLRPKLSQIETSRDEAREEIENLKQSEKTLIACNEKLRLDFEQSETMLAMSGINLLSKETTIDELRSLLVANDVTVGSTTAELDSLHAKHDGVLAKATRLEMTNSELVTCNKTLRLDLEQSEARLASSGICLLSKNATIDELRSLLAAKDITAVSTMAEFDSFRANHDQVLAKATGLEIANSELVAENETLRNELSSAKNELSASCDQAIRTCIESSLAEFELAKAELVARLEFIETSVIDTKKKLSSSQMEALQHKQEAIFVRDQLSRKLDDSAMADATRVKEHDEVVKALKSDIEGAHQIVKSLRSEKGHVERDLFEMRETLWAKEQQMQDDRGKFKEQNGTLIAQIQALEREKSSLSSDRRQSLEQVSLLSVELAREKENDSELRRSRDAACEEARMLRSEITKEQEDHIKDVEQMLEELHSKSRMEARATAVRKLEAENDSRVKDLECSLTRSQRELEELRCTLQSAQQEKEDILDLLMTSHAESEQELTKRSFQKEEEIVSRDIRLQELQSRLDAEEESSTEAHVGYKMLEKKLSAAESREAKAVVEARTFSRRLKAMEDDMYAMAREIEMLINTNEVMEGRLIEMKAARAAAEAEAGTHGAVASVYEKISVDLKTKLEEQVDRNRVLQKEIASLSSSIDQFRIEKENAEAEIVDAERSLEESNFALRASADIVKEKDNELHQMRKRLSETNEKRVILERELRKSNDNAVELNDEVVKVHRDNQREIQKLQSRLEQLRKDVDEKDATLCNQRQDLARLTDELETRSQDLLSVAASRSETVSEVNELRNSLEVSADLVQERDNELQLMKENLSQTNEKLVLVERELRKSNEHVSELKDELDKVQQESQQLQSRVAHLQKDVDEKDATLSCQRQDLVRLTNELESQRQELLSVTASRAEAMSEVNEVRKSLETAESLEEELFISQDIAAKLEVSNRTLVSRVDQLEAAHEQTLNDLAETETSLSCTAQLSKDLEHQVQERQAEGDRLRTQVQLLQSTLSRMKSERVLQEGAAQELEGQITRAAEVKHEREVASLQSDNDEKARMLVELAAKLTARSRLIAHSKLFEQSLIGFIEKMVDRTESLLVGVSGHALKLKMMAGEERDKSMEAPDSECGHQSSVVSSVSCNELFLIVSNARRDFDKCKQEVQHLKRGVDAGASTHPSTPPPTPKYTALSLNLSKMKKLLDERVDCSAFLTSHQETLHGMVDYVELQIDSLLSDLFAARRALESKDEAFAELERLVASKESEKESLHKNLKSLQIYIKQMEGKLEQDRSMEETNHVLDEGNKEEMKKAAVRIICNTLQRRDTASAGQAFRKWSGNTRAITAVDQQRSVAEALARQLDITREKLAILKSHLKHSTRSRTRQSHD
jgi:chromosome segregation ATPase